MKPRETASVKEKERLNVWGTSDNSHGESFLVFLPLIAMMQPAEFFKLILDAKIRSKISLKFENVDGN